MGTERCKRCHGALKSRDGDALQKVWAWLIAGMIAYIPANTNSMLLTSTLTDKSDATIIGGVIELWEYGNPGIAFIVFFASVVIPISKFVAIAMLAVAVHRRTPGDAHLRHKTYEVVEFIGRWSMIDVFVVAILAALVQLDTVATIKPGIAAVSFALSVVFTMLAAQSFDSRMIWDADRTTND